MSEVTLLPLKYVVFVIYSSNDIAVIGIIYIQISLIGKSGWIVFTSWLAITMGEYMMKVALF